jgi:hypothetical protein
MDVVDQIEVEAEAEAEVEVEVEVVEDLVVDHHVQENLIVHTMFVTNAEVYLFHLEYIFKNLIFNLRSWSLCI